MSTSPEYQQENTIQQYKNLQNEVNASLNDLKNIVLHTGVPLEGNCFYVHTTLDLYNELFNKQVNLFWAGTQITRRVCEIGFNAGHSTMLLLLSKPKNVELDFVVFDIGHHAYTRSTFYYMRSKYPNIRFRYEEGDSTVVMPRWIAYNPAERGTYDVVHVDGGHSEHCIRHDMMNGVQLARVGGIVIIDDTNDPIINSVVNEYISTGKYAEINILPSYGYPHRMIQKLSE